MGRFFSWLLAPGYYKQRGPVPATQEPGSMGCFEIQAFLTQLLAKLALLLRSRWWSP